VPPAEIEIPKLRRCPDATNGAPDVSVPVAPVARTLQDVEVVLVIAVEEAL
jgi:hypothetical protein